MNRTGMLLLSLTIACGAMGQDIMAGAQTGLNAPSFSARAVNGGSVSLEALIKDNGALVGLADPRSDEGKRALAFLQQSQQRLQEMKVGVVALIINVGQASTVEKLVKDNGLSIPVVHDAGQKVAKQYGVNGSATIAVVDPDGKVFQRYDATETQPNIGPLALGGARDMVEAIEKAKAEAAGDGEGDGTGESGTGTPPAADAAGIGTAPLAPPSDEDTRQRIRLGWAMIQQGQAATALADARQLAKARGLEPLSALWLAYALEANGEFAEAAVTYRKVLKLQPNNEYARNAVMRIDPDGHWLTEADLPQMLPSGPPPSQPLPAEKKDGAGDGGGANGAGSVNTTSQGQASIGE